MALCSFPKCAAVPCSRALLAPRAHRHTPPSTSIHAPSCLIVAGMADIFSADLGALSREAAVSEEGSGSETDEEEFPISGFKLPRFVSPSDVASMEALPAALKKQGAATLATPIVKPRIAGLVHSACNWLRDEAKVCTMPTLRTQEYCA
jgi:hypothetical protein